jgi:hypothetical protein
MRNRWSVAVLAGCVWFALGACGSDNPSSTPPSSELASVTSDSAAVTSEPSEEPATTAAPPLRGNAATNPACALLTVEQVSEAAGLAVIGILGLPADTTNPAKHSESCTWFLDPKEVQSSLVVQYTVFAKQPKDLLAYYPQVISQGFGTKVADLGDLSKIKGHVLDTIDRRAEIHVSLLTHAEATPSDQAAAIGLMRTVIAGIHQ